MLLATTVNWFFAGLVALVPAQEGMRVLVVDADRHEMVREINRELHPHHPVLAFRLRHLDGGANACLHLGGRDMSDNPGPPFENLQGLRICVLDLASVDIRIRSEIEGSSGLSQAQGRRRILWRPHLPLPATAAETRDFTWLPQMTWIDWSSRKVAPVYLDVNPTPPGVAARLDLPGGELRSCHLASSREGGVEKIPYFRYYSLAKGEEELVPQALADVAGATLQISGVVLKLRLRPRAGPSRDFELKAKNGAIDLLVFNLMEHQMGCGTDRTHAYDFLRFYDLLENAPPIRERRVPRAVLSEATAGVQSDFCESVLLKKVLRRYVCEESPPSSANNRSTCPLVVFEG